MELIPLTDPAVAPASRFAGHVEVTTVSAAAAPAWLSAAVVRFSPGAHTNWHVHALGQTLHVLEGTALVGTRDGRVVAAGPGETVQCSPGEEHWHGATASAGMAHVAILVGDGEADPTTWLEPVDDAAYAAASTN
jgi:quercetin dioxygenase-like cupin family protein